MFKKTGLLVGLSLLTLTILVASHLPASGLSPGARDVDRLRRAGRTGPDPAGRARLGLDVPNHLVLMIMMMLFLSSLFLTLLISLNLSLSLSLSPLSLSVCVYVCMCVLLW